METVNQEEGKKRNLKVYIPLTIVVLAVIIGGWIWYKDYTSYISTDDAYIDADRVAVGSKILGRITKTYVQEGDSVKKNMLLAEIDSTELIAQKLQAIAEKSQSIAAVSQSEAKYGADQEGIAGKKINLQRAKDDLTRAKAQFQGGVITREQYDHAQKNFESAQADLNATQSMLSFSKAQIESAKSSIKSADARINNLETQLRNTKLYAPFDGVVSKRWLMAGDIAQPGQSIFTITNEKNLWVIIYIEETKLHEVNIGQNARFTVDAFPGLTFFGKVFYIGVNTASQFSLIPPSNASGNFTKTTQRVPVKISIDKAVDKHEQVVHPRIISGMSVIMKLVRV